MQSPEIAWKYKKAIWVEGHPKLTAGWWYHPHDHYSSSIDIKITPLTINSIAQVQTTGRLEVKETQPEICFLYINPASAGANPDSHLHGTEISTCHHDSFTQRCIKMRNNLGSRSHSVQSFKGWHAGSLWQREAGVSCSCSTSFCKVGKGAGSNPQHPRFEQRCPSAQARN